MFVQVDIVLIILTLVPCCDSSIGVATVSLNIRKDNYYAPEFPSPINSVNVAKGNYSLKHSKQITRLEASDHDHMNETIVFHIVGESESAKKKFQLRDATVMLIAPVKSGSHFVLVVEAEDEGDPPRRSQCALVVSVQEGDVAGPSIPSEVYTVRVAQGTPPGTRILKIPATDPSDSHLIFSIEAGNGNSEYQIDHNTGVISIKGLKTAGAKLTVHVANHNGKGVDTLVDIQVIKPIWHSSPSCVCTEDKPEVNVFRSQNYSVGIWERTPINSTIYTLPATTDLTGFAIVSGNAHHVFSIDSNGVVRNIHQLNSTQRTEYNLHIQTSYSNGEEALTVLQIRVNGIYPNTEHGGSQQGSDVHVVLDAAPCPGGQCEGGVGRASSPSQCFWLACCILLHIFEQL